MAKIKYYHGIGMDREQVLSLEVKNPIIPRVGEFVEVCPHRGPSYSGVVKTVNYSLEELYKNRVHHVVRIWIV